MPRKKKSRKKIKDKTSHEENIINNDNNDNNDNNNSNTNDTIKLNNKNDNNNNNSKPNSEYENFIKSNQEFFSYLSTKPTTKIYIKKFLSSNKNSISTEIKIKPKSLLQIFNLSSLSNEIKLYTLISILLDQVNFVNSEQGLDQYSPEMRNIINNAKDFYITNRNQNNFTEIKVPKKAFVKIFSKMNSNFKINIVNFIEVTVTRISYKFQESLQTFQLKDITKYKLLNKKYKIFYINTKNEHDFLPICCYSLNKIFDMINADKNIKNLFLNLKLNNESYISYEGHNSNYLDKLKNNSENFKIIQKCRNINKNPDFLSLHVKQQNFDKIEFNDLNNYLLDVSNKLKEKLNLIKNKKDMIMNLSSNENNQFIGINDSNNKVKYINNQYLKLINDNIKLNKLKNKLKNYEVFDYANNKVDLNMKQIEKFNNDLSRKEKIFVEILVNNKKYLVSKNKLLRIYDSWKIRDQEDSIEPVNEKKIRIKMKNIEICEQNIIKGPIISNDNDTICELKEENERNSEEEKDDIHFKKGDDFYKKMSKKKPSYNVRVVKRIKNVPKETKKKKKDINFGSINK